jgi:hypothetical protein
MPVRTTVICHFYNEEDYLPAWLKHHGRLFDHGVLIDYRSTDRSREISRDLVPGWEVRTTRNDRFESYAIDREVMDVERGVGGWKVALNATEFLVTDDLKREIAAFEGAHPDRQGFVTTGCLILESPEQKDIAAPLRDRIWEQYHFGLVEVVPNQPHPFWIQRARLVHKAPDGRYDPGRHTNGVSSLLWPLHLFWYGWCPLSLKKKRNEATRPTIPPENLQLGWGGHHVLDDGQVEDFWRSSVGFCHDLLDGQHPGLNAAFARLAAASP